MDIAAPSPAAEVETVTAAAPAEAPVDVDSNPVVDFVVADDGDPDSTRERKPRRHKPRAAAAAEEPVVTEVETVAGTSVPKLTGTVAFVSANDEPSSFEINGIRSWRDTGTGRLVWHVPDAEVEAFDRHYHVQMARVRRG